LGENDVAYVKQALGFDPKDYFVIPPQVYDYFAGCGPRGAKLESDWNDLMVKYQEAYPEEATELKRRINGKLNEGWEQLLPPKSAISKDLMATRKASGLALQAVVPGDRSFVSGSADLMESTFVNFKGQTEFQNVSARFRPFVSFLVFFGLRLIKIAVFSCSLRVDSVITAVARSGGESGSSRWWPLGMVWQLIRRACSSRGYLRPSSVVLRQGRVTNLTFVRTGSCQLSSCSGFTPLRRRGWRHYRV
jgi:dihydroxyacetone synthase